MKHLYYLRHGESGTNRALRWGGHSNPDLTVRGVKQIEAAGEQAKQNKLKIDAIISSPLIRTRHSARIFARAYGFDPAAITYDDSLVERSFGVLEGKRDPRSAIQYLVDESSIDSYPGVEKLTSLQHRADQTLKQLYKRPEENILIVGHGAFGRALVRAIHSRPINHRGRRLKNGKLLRLI